MKLEGYLKKLGTRKAAKIFKVNISTIGAWRRGTSLPRPETLVKIHTLTRGRVTYSSMIETVAKNSK